MNVKKYFLLLISTIIVLLLSYGCSKDDGVSSKEDLHGTWELIELKIDFAGVPANIIAYLGIDITLVVREDGTYSMTTVKTDVEGEPVTSIETGTWTAGSKKFTINPDDEEQDIKTMKYSVKGDQATLQTILPNVVDQDDEDLMNDLRAAGRVNEDGTLQDVPVTMVYQKIL